MTKGCGHDFMQKTYYSQLEPSDQTKGLPRLPLLLDFEPAGNVITLPDPAKIEIAPLDLRVAINRRKSARQYARQPLTLAELSFLLWSTQGVKMVTERPSTLRTVPSAGARHAFETYLLVNNVEGLTPGLYVFLAMDHTLAPVNLEPGIADQITHMCLDQNQVRTGAATFIWTVVAYRMMWRYGERGYRFMHLDAGHVCQNLYLAAEAIDSGVCAIGAFNDEALNGLLGLDGEERFVIYVGTVGKK